MAPQDVVVGCPKCVLRVRFIAWGCIVLFGLARVGFPVGGDQALFLTYAQGLDRGALLYVDLWDNKQPGIFWFYLLAGKLFGFTAEGVHLFEWLWVCAAGLLLWLAARASLTTLVACELVPLLTVGLYFWWANSYFLGQVEILVILPLAGCLYASAKAYGAGSLGPGMHALYGFCVAVVAAFKLVLVVVPFAIWLVLCFYTASRRPMTLRAFGVRMLMPAVLGAVATLATIALYFVYIGTWSAFHWANFVYPRMALVEIDGRAPATLIVNARWLLGMAFPLCVLLVWKSRDLRRVPMRLLEAQSLAWLTAGIVAIAAQRFSYWAYHFLLLLPPVGLIAASVIDRQLASSSRARPSGRPPWCIGHAAALTIIAMFAIGSLNTLRLLRAATMAARAPDFEHLAAFRTAWDPLYTHRIELTAFLRDPSARSGPIYVFGDPNWLLQAGRAQALPVHGWAWEFMLHQQWADLPAQIRGHRPVYLYVDPSYARMLQKRSPEAAALIADRYEPVRWTSEDGIWYRLKAD